MKHRKSKQAKNLYIVAGIVSASVFVGILGTSATLSGNLSGGDPSGGLAKNSWTKEKPDLSVAKSAQQASVAWDGTYTVDYIVSNQGAKVPSAVTIIEQFEFSRILNARNIRNPLQFSGMQTKNGTEKNRVNCGIRGGIVCILLRGIDKGETLEFSVNYTVEKNPVECETVARLNPATIVPGNVNSNPMAIQFALRGDANPADNTSQGTEVRIDCASITGDLETTTTGPETVGIGRTGEFYVSLRNVGSIKSSTVPVQMTAPAGFEIVKAEGMERGGMCGRDKNQANNKITCSNPSTGLVPGQGVTFKLTLKARTDSCGTGELRSVIAKSLKTPNPKYGEIYDINDSNNSSSIVTACDPTIAQSTETSSSSSSSTSSSSSKKWGGWGSY